MGKARNHIMEGFLRYGGSVDTHLTIILQKFSENDRGIWANGGGRFCILSPPPLDCAPGINYIVTLMDCTYQGSSQGGYGGHNLPHPHQPKFFTLFCQNFNEMAVGEYLQGLCTFKTRSIGHFWLHPWHLQFFETTNSILVLHHDK